MIGGEPLILYGIAAVSALVIARVMYSMASGTMRAAGYALVFLAAAGYVEPDLLHWVLVDIPAVLATLAASDVIMIEIWWEHVEPWQSFGFHTFLGFLGVSLVYRLMEWWYPGAIIGGGIWLWGVVQLDQYLLEHVWYWQPWMDIYDTLVYAGIAGFGLGALVAVVLLEPEFNSTTPGSQTRGNGESDEDVFDQLNL